MNLTRDEREVIIAKTDAEDAWTIHTDSRSAFSSRVRKVAAALGLTPERQGAGWAFTLPLKALSVRVPRGASETEKARRRAAGVRLQQSRHASRENGQKGLSGEESGA